MYLDLDGEALRQFVAPVQAGGWWCLEVEMGEHLFCLDIKKATPASHTRPAEEDEVPTSDEVAELIGRLWIAVSAFPRGARPKEPRRKCGVPSEK